MSKIDLSSEIKDADTTQKAALEFIDKAKRAVAEATAKSDKVIGPSTLGASEASSARKIFESVNEQQGALIAAGLDPAILCAKLLEYAASLAQSAKSRLVDLS